MAAQKAPRRKAFAIKANEGHPLSRRDIQYDFLFHIFDNKDKVFTDPSLSPPAKSTFRDVYVRALIQSPRTAKALREKMVESPDFASDFAKVALLANVGRINTTMTFLPEMRTNLRTYHPVPSLQKVDPNLQDAPRIKNILKACHLPAESNHIPVTPAELSAKIAAGASPSTSVVNLLFVLSNHFTHLSSEHFGRHDVDFLDFFMPVRFSSSSRARAFLWLAHRYYEGTTPNPFDAARSGQQSSTAIPPLSELSPSEFEAENIDTDDEKAYGAKMRKYRLDFLERNAQEQEMADAAPADTAAKGKGKGKGKKGTAISVEMPKRSRAEMETKFDPDAPEDEGDDVRPGQRRRLDYARGGPTGSEANISPHAQPYQRRPRYQPAEIERRMGPQRSIFDQALQEVAQLDPLADSEDEADDGSRFSYGVRLHILDNFSYLFQSPRTTLLPSP